MCSVTYSCLWSDPIEDDDPNMEEVFGVHSSPRGKRSSKFGYDITAKFCAHNKLDLIITSHQTKKGGFGFDVMHDNRLVRVFTARDYEDNSNDGAILHVVESKLAPGVFVVRAKMLRAFLKEDGGSGSGSGGSEDDEQ